MTNGHVVPDEVTITETGMPLGYLYATWNVENADDVLEEGHYDEEQQVWVLPDGVPTMGTYTKTRTNGANCGDCVTDDICA